MQRNNRNAIVIALLFCGLSAFGQAFTSTDPAFLSIASPPASGSAPGDGYEANLFAYFKCEDLTGDLVDEVAGNNFTNWSGTFQSKPGLIANCVDINGADGAGWRAATLDDSHYDLSGHDWTVRCWFYTTENTSLSFLRAMPGVNDSGANDYGWDLYAVASVTPKLHWAGTANDTDITWGSSLSVSNWHRLIIWSQSLGGAGTRIGLQADNDMPMTSDNVDLAMGTVANIALQINYNLFQPSDPDFQLMDEIAIWRDYVLTDDDKTFDWNGGAGRTYPLP